MVHEMLIMANCEIGAFDKAHEITRKLMQDATVTVSTNGGSEWDLMIAFVAAMHLAVAMGQYPKAEWIVQEVQYCARFILVSFRCLKSFLAQLKKTSLVSLPPEDLKDLPHGNPDLALAYVLLARGMPLL